jgi:hypothetical protein
MSYTVINFKTKKAVKEAVAKHKEGSLGSYSVRCYNPGLGPDLSNYTGRVSLEGPHYPQAHTWYCEAELVNGVVVKVK